MSTWTSKDTGRYVHEHRSHNFSTEIHYRQELVDPACHLGARQAGDLLEVGPNGALVSLAERAVAQLLEGVVFDPPVRGGPIADGEFEVGATAEKCADIVRSFQASSVGGHDNPPIIRDSDPSGSLTVE